LANLSHDSAGDSNNTFQENGSGNVAAEVNSQGSKNHILNQKPQNSIIVEEEEDQEVDRETPIQ